MRPKIGISASEANQRTPRPARRIRFLHIPKTAGTTLAKILCRQYSRTATFSFEGNFQADSAHFRALSKRQLEGLKLILGHSLCITGIPEVDEAKTLTLLRHPVARVKSFCQHVYEGKNGLPSAHFSGGSFDLDRFLESGNPELSNLQAWTLVSGEQLCPRVDFDSLSAGAAGQLAVDHLFSKVAHFGIQEYFDESLLLFAQALHWSSPYYVSRNRRNPRNLLRFEERHLQRIEELNQVDLAVYHTARDRFLEKIQAPGFDRARLRRFQKFNRLGHPLFVLREALAFWPKKIFRPKPPSASA